MGAHPYNTRSKPCRAHSPATEPTDFQMGSHCASPPTSKPASFNEDAQMLSHSVAPPIAKPDSSVEGFHMHSCSASLATIKCDSLDGIFHMHSRIPTPRTSNPDALVEVFHMCSSSAALPTFNPASPDEDTQRSSHSRSYPKFDTARFENNVYELTHKYFSPTKRSDSLKSHSPASCSYPCGHWPYMTATDRRYLHCSGGNLHLLEPTETARKNTQNPHGLNRGVNLDHASMTSDDQTTVEVWDPSLRDNVTSNAEEAPIPWAEWIDLPPSPENSPRQTPLTALPQVPYRQSGLLHLNNDPIPKPGSGACRLDPQNSTSRANQRLGSKRRALDLKEALSLVRSTEAQKQAPESTFALCVSSENPSMDYDFPYLDDGFIEFANSSLASTLELPDQYGEASSRPEPASSIDVLTRSAQSELVNMYSMWQEIQSIACELKRKREWTYILCTRVLIHLVRGSINEGQARTCFHYLLQNEVFEGLQPQVTGLFNRNAVDVLRANAIFVEEQLGPEHPAAFTFNIPRSVERMRVLDRNFVEVIDKILLMDLRLRQLVWMELQRRYAYNKFFMQRMNVEDVPASLRQGPVLENEVKDFLDRLPGIAMSFDGIRELVALTVKAGRMDLPALGTFGVSSSRTTIPLQ